MFGRSETTMFYLRDEDFEGITGAELERRIVEGATRMAVRIFDAECIRYCREHGITLDELFAAPIEEEAE